MKNARVLAVITLLAGGTLTPLAIKQVAETNAVEAAQVKLEVEDATIGAAYALKELGRSPSQVTEELARAGVSGPEIDALAKRSAFAVDRDPRAKRSASLAAIVPLDKLAEVTTATSMAMCRPLELVAGLAGAHAECLASHATLDVRPLCVGEVRVGALASLTLTPSQAARVRVAVTPLVEVTDQVDTRLLSLGWWHCGSEPPKQADPAPNPNLSNPE